MTGIAKQYALAVFSLAKEKGNELEFLSVLQEFSNQLDEEMIKFFTHPKISRDIKKGTLEKSVKEPLLLNLLKVLIDNDRFDIIEACTLAYQDILDEMNKVMQVKVYSNKPLTQVNIDKIKKKLKSTYQRTIEIQEEIDHTILGGFRLEFEGNVIDETINRKLDDMHSSLLD